MCGVIAATLPLGSVGYEPKVDTKGERLIWLEAAIVERLRAMRGPGESYSCPGGALLASWRGQQVSVSLP